MEQNFIQNIAEDLSRIDGTLTEIKEAQVNCATTDDVNAIGQNVGEFINNELVAVKDASLEASAAVKKAATESADAVTKTVNDGMKEVKTNVATEFTAMRNGIAGEMAVVRKTMTTEAGNLTSAAKKISDRIDRFTANPPEQRIRHIVDKSVWQWYAVLATSFVSVVLCAVFFLWQEGRIEQCRQSDIKYHMILMHGGISQEGLDTIEAWFQDPEKVAEWEQRVRDHEQRVAETARAIQNRDRLNARIQELNSAENQNSNSSNSNPKTH